MDALGYLGELQCIGLAPPSKRHICQHGMTRTINNKILNNLAKNVANVAHFYSPYKFVLSEIEESMDEYSVNKKTNLHSLNLLSVASTK
jgi:hypothetical protein